MILESVRDHHGMSPAARDRAFELGRDGYIDMRGTWKLTPKGEVYLASVYRQNPVSKPVLIALGIGGAALVGIVAWRIYSQPAVLPAPAPAPSPLTPLTPVEPPLPAPQSGMWVPTQTMATGSPYLAVFKIMPGAPKPSPQDLLTLASAGRMVKPTIIYWPNSGMPWPVELASASASIDRSQVSVMTFEWQGQPQTAAQVSAVSDYLMVWQPFVSNA